VDDDILELKIKIPSNPDAVNAIGTLANRNLPPEQALAVRGWLTKLLQEAGRADADGNLIDHTIEPPPPLEGDEAA
jgi:hypothetical protein